MSESIKADKLAMRKRIKAVLSKIEAKEVEEQSQSVARKVLQLPVYQEATTISIFLSMPNREISTSDIVLDALRQDKKVFIPYIYSSKDNPKTKIMDMLRLRDEEDLRSLRPDAWGIPSLSANDVELRENAMGGFGLSDHLSQPKSSGSPGLDLIFMPGMAFDKLNHRLGHGKGFYDRYISRLHQKDSAESSSRTNPALVGLALREQLLPEGENVPVDDWDRQIDQLIISD